MNPHVPHPYTPAKPKAPLTPPASPPPPPQQQQAQNYLRTRVMTATPEQLQMMLFDGAVKFLEQARMSLEKRDWEGTYNHISRTQKIITELLGSLRHDVNRDLCGKLAGLYTFA